MSEPLPIVDGLKLSEEYRALLKPGEIVRDGNQPAHRLPRYFYAVESWQQARETKLTVHFTLSELMSVDCREAPLLLREFPHYVPCTISILARYLETFRERVEAPVCVRVNGGYRSPAHRFSAPLDLHSWGTAVDIYRIGDTWMDSQKNVERYARIAEGIGQEVYAAPFGAGAEETDDHLHLDLGFLHIVPRGMDEGEK